MYSSQVIQRLQALKSMWAKNGYMLPINQEDEYDQLLAMRRGTVKEYTGLKRRLHPTEEQEDTSLD